MGRRIELQREKNDFPSELLPVIIMARDEDSRRSSFYNACIDKLIAASSAILFGGSVTNVTTNGLLSSVVVDPNLRQQHTNSSHQAFVQRQQKEINNCTTTSIRCSFVFTRIKDFLVHCLCQHEIQWELLMRRAAPVTTMKYVMY